MNTLLDIENKITNAKSGGQPLPLALVDCSNDQSILPVEFHTIPLWIKLKNERELEEKKHKAEQEALQRKRQEEEYRKKQEEARQQHLKEERIKRGTADPIDLGLSVLWASHNVGARSCEQQGVYVSWNQKKKATDMWGEGWRLPTLEEMMELMQRCQWQWTSRNNMPGFLLTGNNGNQIFLPAGGSCVAMQYDSYGVAGRYWCDTPDSQYIDRAMYLEFNQSSGNIFSVAKTMQLTIRPVKNK